MIIKPPHITNCVYAHGGWDRTSAHALHVERERGGRANFCCFKVKERALGRKRKHSEVNNQSQGEWT
jgi:hypothetical protein